MGLSYLFLTVLVLRCCAGFSLVVVGGGDSVVALHGLLIGGFSCCGAWALGSWGLQQSRCAGSVVEYVDSVA